MNKNIQILLALLAVILVLCGTGCTENTAKTAEQVPEYSDSADTQLESEATETIEIISTVDLSAGEMLNATGKAWRSENDVIYVELDVTNLGNDNISVAYAASFFDNGKDPIMQSWDDGNVTITPGNTQTFYLESEPHSEEFFSKANSPVRFQFSLSANDGETQKMVYKGETNIPFLEEGKPVVLDIKKVEE